MLPMHVETFIQVYRKLSSAARVLLLSRLHGMVDNSWLSLMTEG